GSGGYGAPSERDPKLIGADLVGGYVTAEAARRDYGIADPESLQREARKGIA
ncbi:MAG: hypothetical protein JSS20_20180, partial [Proteobacteria bacterium]|nr:hypothetical protein [Pseudomonadota bacterium]